MTEERTVIVLAAGEGKRMKSATPKVLHPMLGRTLVGHVLAAATAVRPDRRVVVVSRNAQNLTDHLATVAPDAVAVVQEEQLGTGHAVRVAVESAGIAAGTVVVAFSDTPLLRPETFAGLVEAHETAGAAVTILTAIVDEPFGLGRILRNADGEVEAIVEERDATPDQRAIKEINAGVYAFDAALLNPALGKLTTQNAQGEEYLTDVIGVLVDSGRTVQAYPVADQAEALGCNDRVQLSALRAILRDRVNKSWQLAGVTIVDPATTWIDVTVDIGADAVIEPNTHLRGETSVGSGAVVGPDVSLIDTTVGEFAHIVRAHAVGSVIGPRVNVGPYASLRPGTILREGSKAGTFVEMKNADVGAGTKVPHLSYVGDATIGEESNIAAANVFANYDGKNKNRSVIGDHVHTGVDNTFVAPVTVGDGAYIAAGSVIDKNVPPGALGVARAQQRNIEGWVKRRRAGSKAAQAAEAAESQATSSGDDAAGPTTSGDTSSE